MSYFYLDTKEFDKVATAIENFSDRSVAEQIINDYLVDDGGKKIKEYRYLAERGMERKQLLHRPIHFGYRGKILR